MTTPKATTPATPPDGATAKRPPGRPRNLSLPEQRLAIIAAARRVFAEHDFHGTTIERVAREAGLARPAVYELFGGKDELFVAVVDDACDQVITSMSRRFLDVAGLPFRQIVRQGVEGLFEFIADQPDVAAIIRIAEYGGFGPAKAEVLDARRRIEHGLANLFQLGWADFGGIGDDASKIVSLMTLSMVEAVGFRQPSEPTWPAEVTIDVITEFLMGGLSRLGRHPELMLALGQPPPS